MATALVARKQWQTSETSNTRFYKLPAPSKIEKKYFEGSSKGSGMGSHVLHVGFQVLVGKDQTKAPNVAPMLVQFS